MLIEIRICMNLRNLVYCFGLVGGKMYFVDAADLKGAPQ